MKIYFAGSIRGGRDDEQLYRELIAELQQMGTVLTEHIAHPRDLELGMTDREIYDRDMAWLAEADVVVAEVTTPSLGVGYELASAEGLGKPIICLFRPSLGRSLSAMLAGPGMMVVEYETAQEALQRVAGFLSDLTG
jgi:nucleoside 2-deoxyribosyltransferase